MGLGSVPIGAFDDERLRDVLDLPADREVVYPIPIGEPAPYGLPPASQRLHPLAVMLRRESIEEAICSPYGTS
jgi:nitroreductase